MKRRNGILYVCVVICAVLLMSPGVLFAQDRVEMATYTIFRDGPTTYARNGRTGLIDYSGTDSATVIQQVFDATFNAGANYQVIALQGQFSIESPLRITRGLHNSLVGLGGYAELRAGSTFPAGSSILTLDAEGTPSVSQYHFANIYFRGFGEADRCVTFVEHHTDLQFINCIFSEAILENVRSIGGVNFTHCVFGSSQIGYRIYNTINPTTDSGPDLLTNCYFIGNTNRAIDIYRGSVMGSNILIGGSTTYGDGIFANECSKVSFTNLHIHAAPYALYFANEVKDFSINGGYIGSQDGGTGSYGINFISNPTLENVRITNVNFRLANGVFYNAPPTGFRLVNARGYELTATAFTTEPQMGEVTVSTNGTGIKNGTINFPRPYKAGYATPIITLTLKDPSNPATRFSDSYVSGVSVNGFQYNVVVTTSGGGGSTVKLQWRASQDF